MMIIDTNGCQRGLSWLGGVMSSGAVVATVRPLRADEPWPLRRAASMVTREAGGAGTYPRWAISGSGPGRTRPTSLGCVVVHEVVTVRPGCGCR